MSAQSKRPLSVTSLAALVLTFTGTQFLRAWVLFANLDFYNSLPMSVPPLFLALSSVVWGSLGAWLVRGLWRGETWAPRAAQWGLAAFLAYGWLDRLVFQARGPQTTSWPFDAALTGLLLLAVFGLLALPRTRAYFGVRHG